MQRGNLLVPPTQLGVFGGMRSETGNSIYTYVERSFFDDIILPTRETKQQNSPTSTNSHPHRQSDIVGPFRTLDTKAGDLNNSSPCTAQKYSWGAVHSGPFRGIDGNRSISGLDRSGWGEGKCALWRWL